MTRVSDRLPPDVANPMHMIRDAMKKALPPGMEFVIVVFDSPEIVADRRVSFITSGDKDQARHMLQDWINKTA